MRPAGRLATVRCLTFRPGEGLGWRERRAPPGDGAVAVRPVALGIDGTDEAVARGRGEPAEELDDLVLGHEALLRVLEPGGTGFRAGQLVVPLVRRGCGRCEPCLRRRSDLCETGLYREHGIKGLDGWWADRALAQPEELVPVPERLGVEAVLAEPLSISVKALEHARAVRRARTGRGFDPGARALVVGLGSLGSQAALLLADQGFEVHVAQRDARDADCAYADAVGARAHATVADAPGPFELVLDTPGAAQTIADALAQLSSNGVLVALGTPEGGRRSEVPMARMVRELVLENQSLLGSVNANRGHLEEALAVLARWRARDAEPLRLLLARPFAPEEGARVLAADAPLKKIVVWPDTVPNGAAPGPGS